VALGKGGLDTVEDTDTASREEVDLKRHPRFFLLRFEPGESFLTSSYAGAVVVSMMVDSKVVVYAVVVSKTLSYDVTVSSTVEVVVVNETTMSVY